MANLYELSNDYIKLQELLEEGELDPEMLEEAMQYTKEELSIKFENYCKVIRNIENNIAGLKAEEDRMSARRKAMENNIKNMKARMLDAMVTTDTKKIDGELFTISRQKNPASVVMDVNYIEDVPEKYLIEQDPKIDKKKLAEDLKAGVELDGIAHLEQGEGIRIK